MTSLAPVKCWRIRTWEIQLGGINLEGGCDTSAASATVLIDIRRYPEEEGEEDSRRSMLFISTVVDRKRNFVLLPKTMSRKM